MASKRSNMNAAVRYHGRHVASITAAQQVAGYNLSPNSLDARLVTVSDAFQEFRFTRVKARVLHPASSVLLAVSYTPAILGTTPTSYSDLQNLEDTAYGDGLYGSPLPCISLGRRQLCSASPVKWFRRGTPYDDTLEVQGTLYFASSAGFNVTSIVVLIEYDIEFRAMADTGLTLRKSRPVSNDPIALLEAKIADMQSVMNVAPNPVQPNLLTATAPSLGHSAQCADPKSEYVLVRRNA